MKAAHNHRDPLTQRYARTVRDTLRDPYAYSEGPAEQELVDVARSFPPQAARARRAQGRRIDVAAVLGLASGCLGNCKQGRAKCTLPGTCNRPRGHMPDGDDDTPTVPMMPFPAEACTELGIANNDGDRSDERRRMQMLIAAMLGAAAGVTTFAWLVHILVSAQ